MTERKIIKLFKRFNCGDTVNEFTVNAAQTLHFIAQLK